MQCHHYYIRITINETILLGGVGLSAAYAWGSVMGLMGADGGYIQHPWAMFSEHRGCLIPRYLRGETPGTWNKLASWALGNKRLQFQYKTLHQSTRHRMKKACDTNLWPGHMCTVCPSHSHIHTYEHVSHILRTKPDGLSLHVKSWYLAPSCLRTWATL